MPFSPDLYVMGAPARVYAESIASPSLGRWGVVSRPLLTALVMGTASAFAATGHVTLGLVASGLVCWSFVPLLQIATAVAIMGPRLAARRAGHCGRARARRRGHRRAPCAVVLARIRRGGARVARRRRDRTSDDRGRPEVAGRADRILPLHARIESTPRANRVDRLSLPSADGAVPDLRFRARVLGSGGHRGDPCRANRRLRPGRARNRRP